MHLLLESDASLYLFDGELEHPSVAVPDPASLWKIPGPGVSLPGCTKHLRQIYRHSHTSPMSSFALLVWSQLSFCGVGGSGDPT